jgi:hypothetical protein
MLKNVSAAGMHHDGSAFLVESAEKPAGIFRVCRLLVYLRSRSSTGAGSEGSLLSSRGRERIFPSPGSFLGSMDRLPATVLDGAPIEVRVEIFQPESIIPVVQPGMSDCLPFTEVTESAVGNL